MAGQGVQVTVKGPLLEGKAPFIVRETIRDCIKAIAAEGERQIKLQARPRPAGAFHTADYARAHGYRQTGNYARSIHGEMTSSMHGVIHDSESIYGPWLEGVSSRNDQTRFKGYALFRRAKQQLERLKLGIIQNNLAKLLRRLG